jgi:hypothetical protein
MKKLLPLSEFVHFLNCMTTTELLNEFPNSFHLITPNDSVQQNVEKLLANDGILWRFVKEYNQFLMKKITLDMIEGDNKIFGESPKVVSDEGTFDYFINDKVLVSFKDNVIVPDLCNIERIGDLCAYNVEIIKYPCK